jgi:hypothetical protein
MPKAAQNWIDVREWISTLESIRQLRMQRHMIIAAVAGLLIVFAPLIPDPTTELVVVAVLVGVVLQSLARGLNAGFGYMWGWPYPEPDRSTRLDQFVDRVVRRFKTPPAANGIEEPAVRVLDPWED